MSELTPFEEFKFQVQTQIDFIVSKFQDSIQKFEALVQANKDLAKENEDLKVSMVNLRFKFDSLVIDFGSFIVDHSDSVKAQSKVNNQFENMHMNQTSINCVFSKDLGNVFSECVKSKDKIEEILKMIGALSIKIDSVDAKYAAIPDLIEKLSGYIDFFRLKLVTIEGVNSKNESLIKDIRDLAEKNSLDALSIAKGFSEFRQNTLNSIDELKKAQVYFQEAIPKVIDLKIAEIPKPVIPSIEEAKKAFQNQLEPVSLDAKNSALRSVNTESKLHILEKKIEQLKLILDQLTIGK